MKVTVRGIEREVTVRRENEEVFRCHVGKALVFWSVKYQQPYVMIKGSPLDVIMKWRPMIVEYLKEYKRLVSKPKSTPPIAIEGDESDYVYQQKMRHHDPEYVSGCPLWLTQLKEWKLCQGKKHTYMRRVRLPVEHKDLAVKYLPHCCNCQERVGCIQPCLNPEFMCKQEILAGIEHTN